MDEHNPPAHRLGREWTGEDLMMVKRVAGAIGAELKAVNLADGIAAAPCRCIVPLTGIAWAHD